MMRSKTYFSKFKLEKFIFLHDWNIFVSYANFSDKNIIQILGSLLAMQTPNRAGRVSASLASLAIAM